jgi:hypothetical protein
MTAFGIAWEKQLVSGSGTTLAMLVSGCSSWKCLRKLSLVSVCLAEMHQQA